MDRIAVREHGLGMVEALVAMAILALISAPIFGAFLVARSAQAESTGRAIAQSIARTRIEEMQRQAYTDWADMANQGPAPDPAYPGYNVRVTVEPVPGFSEAADALKTVTVEVTWTGTKRRQLTYRLATRMERRL